MEIQAHRIVGAWFGTCLIALIFSSLLLVYISMDKTINPSTNSYRLYLALPQTQVQITDNIKLKDARSLIVENYLKKRGSPLFLYSDLFISTADYYQLDYRLLPAIAMQESNGGKRIPENSNNPFGFGIYGSKKLHFQSWEDAIETVGKALREDYLNQGLHTPYQIMTKYTPPSVEKGGPWAIGVSQFMEELR